MSSQHVTIIRKALAVVRPQFRLDFNEGIHGLPHWARVWHHGRALAASLDVNPAVLTWFAFLHDSDHGADVLYHLLVLMRAGGVSLDEVLDELQRRTAQSGHQEKASRGT